MYDLVIIGAGPVGLYGAFYSGLQGLQTLVLEGEALLGGSLVKNPERLLTEVPGFSEIRSDHLLEQLLLQIGTVKEKVSLLTGVYVTEIQSSPTGSFFLAGVETKAIIWTSSLEKQTVQRNQRCQRPNVYAVGDCCDYVGKVPGLVSGFAEMVVAVNGVKKGGASR